MSDFKERRVEAWKAINEARAKVDAAEAEGRDLTAEEEAFVEKALADSEAITKEADRAERKSRLGEVAAVLGVEDTERPRIHGSEESVKTSATREYEREFKGYLRGETPGPVMRKALQEGVNSEGGYIVPPEFLARLVDTIADFTPMLGLATVVDTSTNVVEYPTVASHGAAAWTAEEAAFNESDPAFGTGTITVHKATRIVKVSEELLADSAFDLDSFMSTEFGRSIGLLLNTALTTGDGSAKPFGVVGRVDAGQVVTDATGSTTSISSADHLFDVKHTVKPQYRNRSARWMFTDLTLKAIALLKDTTDQYLWNPDLRGESPGSLLGAPAVINPDVAEMAASAKSIVYGDFSYFWVCRRPAISIQRLNELYAANGQVGFRVFVRYGSDLTLTTEPLAIGQNSAT